MMPALPFPWAQNLSVCSLGRGERLFFTCSASIFTVLPGVQLSVAHILNATHTHAHTNIPNNAGMDKATMLSTLQSNDVNQTLYTLVSWDGGRDYYKTCNLWLREPDFVGFCMPSAVSANIAQLDGILPSEARTRCNELCVCEATCATTAAEGEPPTEFCGCRSCAPDAAYGAMDQYVMAPPPSARHLLQVRVVSRVAGPLEFPLAHVVRV